MAYDTILEDTNAEGELSTVAGNSEYKVHAGKSDLGLRKPLHQLQNLQKHLFWRIFALSTVSGAYAAIIIIELATTHIYTSSKTHISWCLYMSLLGLLWLSVV